MHAPKCDNTLSRVIGVCAVLQGEKQERTLQYYFHLIATIVRPTCAFRHFERCVLQVRSVLQSPNFQSVS